MPSIAQRRVLCGAVKFTLTSAVVRLYFVDVKQAMTDPDLLVWPMGARVGMCLHRRNG